MKIIRSPQAMQRLAMELSAAGRRIGLVPTMGALHEGHLSLARRCRRECECVIVSIFVNPAQFGPNEDYLRYPRPFAQDAALCRVAGVDILFVPSAEDMYPPGYLTYITVEKISDIMCGAFRPGHFRGVATVVAKLFNLCRPHRAYFGAKDFQQVRVIRRMADDLHFPVRIAECPIVREKSGLALSSRNTYLSEDERSASTIISKSLQQAVDLVQCEKLKTSRKIIQKIQSEIRRIPGSRIDYVEVRDAETLAPLTAIVRPAVLAVAVWVGRTRLIDNIVIRYYQNHR